MASAPLPLEASPIVFGTDGWRGLLGVDITVERLLPVAAAAARELAASAPADLSSREVVLGYDRRFLAPELAEAIAAAVRGAGLEPLLAASPTPTPASSWAVLERGALGALVITASHNPPEWLGLKIKGPFGGSVEGDFTQRVERRLAAGGLTVPMAADTQRFDALGAYVAGLRAKVDVAALAAGLDRLGLRVIVDPMHGSAAGVLPALLGEDAVNAGVIREIRANRDPLFGGHPPEPLAAYLEELIKAVRASTEAGQPAMGIVFDGDGDRIAAVDERGRFCSTQLLMPLFIDHLARVRQLPGSVIKTVSGSDLMALVAGGLPLGQRLDGLQARCGGAAAYDRLDLRLADMAARERLEARLAAEPPAAVAGEPVLEVIRTDGVKLRLGPSHWLMLRFSGTEPLLRLYCEAPDSAQVDAVLDWARQLAESI